MAQMVLWKQDQDLRDSSSFNFEPHSDSDSDSDSDPTRSDGWNGMLVAARQTLIALTGKVKGQIGGLAK